MIPALGAALEAAKLWLMVRPVRRAQKAIRRVRNKRRERLGKQPLDVDFSDEKEFDMILKGKLSWVGIATTAVGMILGWIGIGDCSTADAAAGLCVPPETIAEHIVSLIDQALMVAGLIMTARGRARQARVVYKDEVL